MDTWFLYDQFFQEIKPKNKPPFFVIKQYIMNSRMKSKTFTVKTYGSRSKAQEAAIQYFENIYHFRPPVE